MGLCKCPRKKVTNLFCFEHRVNVCEHCLLARHSQCVVQSYLEWLQDSDYDPNCQLCGKALADASQSAIRLTCLHVYHWQCVDAWAQQHPKQTAPAGYLCPMCRTPVIPKQHQAGWLECTTGPIADQVREQLKQANWARHALGLELLPNMPEASAPQQRSAQQTTSVQIDGSGEPGTMVSRKPQQQSHDVEDYSQHSGSQQQQPLLAGKPDVDAQQNKYRRRSAMEWFSTWIRSRSSTSRGGGGSSDTVAVPKRWLCVLLLLVLGLITLITVLTRVAGSGDDYDPFLDPLANPNIRIGDFERKQDIMGNHI